ncbi:hypothetical protein AAW14_07860 [Streptomyces hygroscopicus]|uniref:hypothetical protein n=1 Tax=Streptomyces hygroscopicus TaxID=1912 RepID=UPI00223F79BC|nr:hypothetical protein [Streptomyces hygroscopicus]MCW7941947.1 hypothetical protein [Streptomyces hygroscopicus]
MPLFSFNTVADYLKAAHEMAASGRTALARLLAEAAAEFTPDPVEAARILNGFPASTQREED